MQSYNIDSSLALFKKQLSVIDRQIEELRLIRSRVESRCEQMEASQAHRREADAVTIEEMPEQYLLALPVDPPYTLREISIATKKCFAEGFGNKLPVFFQCGVIVPLEKIRDGRYTEASYAFLPVEKAEGEGIPPPPGREMRRHLPHRRLPFDRPLLPADFGLLRRPWAGNPLPTPTSSVSTTISPPTTKTSISRKSAFTSGKRDKQKVPARFPGQALFEGMLIYLF